MHLAHYMYKVDKGITPESQQKLFKRVYEESHRKTRSSGRNDFAIPRMSLSSSDKCICVRGPKYYNQLDQELKNLNSLDIFKRQINDTYKTLCM